MENLFEKIKSIVEASVFFYILGRILFGNTFFIFFIISIFFFFLFLEQLNLNISYIKNLLHLVSL